MVQVPRLHYKHLDGIDYARLRDQYEEYAAKSEYFGEVTRVRRE